MPTFSPRVIAFAATAILGCSSSTVPDSSVDAGTDVPDTAAGDATGVTMGTIDYSSGCRTTATNPACNPGEMIVREATSNSGNPPAIVSCAIALGAGGAPSRLRFSIGRSNTGSLTEGTGISLCGDVSGPAQDMRNTRVALYFGGDTSPNNPAPGICTVHINSDLTATAFSGTITCLDAMTQSIPPKLRYIQGSGTTADPMHGEFSFQGCTVLTTGCPP